MKRKLILVSLLAVAFALSGAQHATAQETATRPPTADGGVEPQVAEAETPVTSGKRSRPPFKFELGMGITFDQQFLRTRAPDGRRFTFTGMGFRLRSYLGRRFGFLFDGAFLLPIVGTEPGRGTFRLRQTYSKVLGADLLPMFAYRGEFRERFAFRAGIGPHNIRPFQNTSLGVGISGDVLYDITKIFHIGGQATLAVDFVDLIHDTGKLKTLTAWNIGVLIGVRIR